MPSSANASKLLSEYASRLILDAEGQPSVSGVGEFLRVRPRDWRTTLGIFYTPGPLAETLVDWAITDRNQTVLEPSFGGCGFAGDCPPPLDPGAAGTLETDLWV